MAKAKTPKAPKEEKQIKVEDVSLDEAQEVAVKAVKTEDIDLDAELEAVKTVHGTGIQAYMRQKIAEATERK